MSTCILLATYNGARYLPELLASLERQSVENWQLLVRDDTSTDATSDILTAAAESDRRIRILHGSPGRLGAAHNFGALMQAALTRDVQYVAFADQDDVWLPDKLERQLARMRQAEKVDGREIPRLIHSDLTIVDEGLTIRHESFMRWNALPSGDRVSPAKMLVRNSVVGCTMLANRPLLELAVPVPLEMVMHDWWLGLLAVTCGQLLYDDAPTVLYRQHANNEIGATSLPEKIRAGFRDWRQAWNRALRNSGKGVLQARALRDRIRELPDQRRPECFSLVDAYCRLFDLRQNPIVRLWRSHQLGINDREAGWLRQVLLAARMAAYTSPAVDPANRLIASSQPSGSKRTLSRIA